MPSVVSCIMVTQASRRAMAARAIECFLQQSYAWRELIIVSVDPVDDLEARGRLLGGPPIFAVRAPAGLTLGDLRNFGIARARGGLIACWDDDDLSHPDRLSIQIQALAGLATVAGCVLTRVVLAWPARNLYMLSQVRPWEGTLVCHRWQQPAYPARPRDEDRPLLKNIPITAIGNEPTLYTYVVHGANTSGVAHFDDMFRAEGVMPASPVVVARTRALLGVVVDGA